MQEMDRRVALLRLLLADIEARARQSREASDQLRAQMRHVVDFAVRRNAAVTSTLAALVEIEERLAQEERTRRHLGLLRQRARAELDALVVTRGVADAHARLAALEGRRAALLAAAPGAPTLTGEAAASTAAPSGELADIEAEIAELHAAIQSASDAAARSLIAGADPSAPES